jgi:hypothetical protein
MSERSYQPCVRAPPGGLSAAFEFFFFIFKDKHAMTKTKTIEISAVFELQKGAFESAFTRQRDGSIVTNFIQRTNGKVVPILVKRRDGRIVRNPQAQERQAAATEAVTTTCFILAEHPGPRLTGRRRKDNV